MVSLISHSLPFCPHHFPSSPSEALNTLAGSLTTDKFYDLLCSYIEDSRIDELKGLDSDLLLQQNSVGETLLHLAASRGDAKINRFMIERTGTVLFNVKTEYNGYTPLHLAMYGNNDEITNLLLEKAKEESMNDFLNQPDSYGQTALHHAAYQGNLKACQQLYPIMSDQAILLQTKGRKQTILHFAVQIGNKEIVKFLLTRKELAKELLLKTDCYGQTVLHWAAGDGNYALVDIIIDNAGHLSDEEAKRFFLMKKKEGFTALHLAAHSKDNASIRSLVMVAKSRKIPELISTTDDYGQTALHWTAAKGNVEASKLLCNEMDSSMINIKMTGRGQTALHFAAHGAHLETIKILIDKGADKSIRDVNGMTAYEWAKENLKIASKDAIIAMLKPT